MDFLPQSQAEPLNQLHEPKPQFPQWLKGANECICSLLLGPIKCSDEQEAPKRARRLCSPQAGFYSAAVSILPLSHCTAIIPEAFGRHVSLHRTLVLGIHAPLPAVPPPPLQGLLSAWNFPYLLPFPRNSLISHPSSPGHTFPLATNKIMVELPRPEDLEGFR